MQRQPLAAAATTATRPLGRTTTTMQPLATRATLSMAARETRQWQVLESAMTTATVAAVAMMTMAAPRAMATTTAMRLQLALLWLLLQACKRRSRRYPRRIQPLVAVATALAVRLPQLLPLQPRPRQPLAVVVLVVVCCAAFLHGQTSRRPCLGWRSSSTPCRHRRRAAHPQQQQQQQRQGFTTTTTAASHGSRRYTARVQLQQAPPRPARRPRRWRRRRRRICRSPRRVVLVPVVGPLPPGGCLAAVLPRLTPASPQRPLTPAWRTSRPACLHA